MRLRPVAPILLPHCAESDTTLGGYVVPKDTLLVVNAYAMAHDPNVILKFVSVLSGVCGL